MTAAFTGRTCSSSSSMGLEPIRQTSGLPRSERRSHTDEGHAQVSIAAKLTHQGQGLSPQHPCPDFSPCLMTFVMPCPREMPGQLWPESSSIEIWLEKQIIYISLPSPLYLPNIFQIVFHLNSSPAIGASHANGGGSKACSPSCSCQ